MVTAQNASAGFSSIVVYVIEQETGDTITSDYELTLYKNQKEVFTKHIDHAKYKRIDSLETGSFYEVQVLKEDFLGNKISVDLSESKEPVEFIVGVHIIEGCRRIPPPTIPFDLNSADLDFPAKDSLNYIANVLKENPTIVVSFDVYQFLNEDKQVPKKRIHSISSYLKKQGVESKRVEYNLVSKEENWPSSRMAVGNLTILRWDNEE